MTSRFVSAGGEEVKPPEGLSEASDDAWTKARKQVEDSKKSKDEGPALGTQEGGKSLYDHLQAQKAAKQEAFEEATKLRNQFRPLDDSEIDFLERVKQTERLKAVSERKETADQLEIFRKEQAAAELAARGDNLKNEEPLAGVTETEVWTAAKKRRRGLADEKLDKTKTRKLSSQDKNKGEPEALKGPTATTAQAPTQPISEPIKATESAGFSTMDTATKPTLSLVAYDSDSDD